MDSSVSRPVPAAVLAVLVPVLSACGPLSVSTEAATEPATHGLAAPSPPVPVSPALPTSATIALAREGERTVAYVADEDDRAVLTIDVLTGRVLARTWMGGTPSSLLIGRGGALFVTVADRDVVRRYRSRGVDRALQKTAEARVASEPLSLARYRRGLLAVSGWGRAVTELATESGGLEATRVIPVGPEPRAAIAANGKIWVAHAVLGTVTVIDGRSPAYRTLDAVMLETAPSPAHHRHRTLVSVDAIASVATHAHAWIPLSGERIVSPAVFVHPGPPRATRGYGSDFAAARTGMIELATTSGTIGTVRLPLFRRPDDPLTGTPNPLCTVPRAGAATRPDRIVIACDGLDQVVEYFMDLHGGPTYAGSFTVGAGVTGVAYDPRQDWVVSWSQIDRKLTIIALRSAAVAPPLTWERSPALIHTVASHASRDAQLDRGRRVFHESSDRIARDGRSCVSCHPGGRQDGFVWSTPAGPRQTPMLAGRLAETAPYGWDGSARELRDHVRETIARLGGTGLPDDDLDALSAYAASMPGPGPSLVAAGAEADAIARGREIFESAGTGCADCHRRDRAYTNERTHAVLGIDINPPSLRYVAGTAPYMHDGRYATLEDVLDATDGQMGHTSHLPPEDRAALLAFLRTL